MGTDGTEGVVGEGNGGGDGTGSGDGVGICVGWAAEIATGTAIAKTTRKTRRERFMAGSLRGTESSIDMPHRRRSASITLPRLPARVRLRESRVFAGRRDTW